jgi:Raf kinase inhibitor-like YbhB/YbcL family protein
MMLTFAAAVAVIQLSSPTIVANQPIPRDHTADGRNISPALTWSVLPLGTKELALVCEDPDAGNPPPFVHWVIYRIPPAAMGLPEDIPFEPGAPMPREIAGAVQGSPASGVPYIEVRRRRRQGPSLPLHPLRLDASLGLEAGLTRVELLEKIKDHGSVKVSSSPPTRTR